MVFKVLHESLKTYINNLISSTIGVLLLQTREQSWRHGNLILCRPRAKLCPLARRTYFSGWRAVSHADLVWKSRADLESALGVPFGGNLVENRPEPGNSSNFPLAPLGPDMPRASGHAQPGTGDGGWPEAGWETAAGRADTRRLGVARNRSRERHHRQHRGSTTSCTTGSARSRQRACVLQSSCVRSSLSFAWSSLDLQSSCTRSSSSFAWSSLDLSSVLLGVLLGVPSIGLGSRGSFAWNSPNSTVRRAFGRMHSS